jgi:hypothetical protein
MTITFIATILLLWFVVGTGLAFLIGPMFNHTSCGCWPQNLQKATVRSVNRS